MLLISVSKEEERQILIQRNICPHCYTPFEIIDQGEEQEYRYLVCPNGHFKSYLGMTEDIDE